MKLPLQIKDRNGLTVDILDANGDLVAVVSGDADAAQIVSAVNQHRALVFALEGALARLEGTPSPHSETVLSNCRNTLLEVMRDAVPHVSRQELDQITEAKTI